MWDIYSNKEYDSNDTKKGITGSFPETLSIIDEMIEILSVVFLVGGIFLCVFALLLLSNFISISISNKTKEIGILRAIGASKKDISRVFNAETFIIGLLSGIFGIMVNSQ